jgi:glycosyltransferase involved in cell wall biosynthesis
MVAASCRNLGGQGIQAQTLLRELEAEGYAVELIPIDPSLGPALAWIRRAPVARTLVNEALYVPSLARLRRADVVHVFCAAYWAFLLAAAPALVVARALGKRVVLNYHSGEAAEHLERWGVALHPWLRLADVIVVPSDYLREIFAEHGYVARTIPNVVDLSEFRYRERAELAPRFLSNRNLEPYYAVGDVLRAFALIEATRPDATLAVVGTGSEEVDLRRSARRLGLRNIRFLGRVEHSAMPGLYDDADILLNASVVDNQPLTILEAFACGLAVISTPTGDLRTMVRDGETGLTVPPHDPAAMARAALALLERHALAVALTHRAHRSLARHQWSSVRSAWADAYRGDLW